MGTTKRPADRTPRATTISSRLLEEIYGAFERTVTLPCAVRADQAVAEFADGILTLTLPKAESA